MVALLNVVALLGLHQRRRCCRFVVALLGLRRSARFARLAAFVAVLGLRFSLARFGCVLLFCSVCVMVGLLSHVALVGLHLVGLRQRRRRCCRFVVALLGLRRSARFACLRVSLLL